VSLFVQTIASSAIRRITRPNAVSDRLPLTLETGTDAPLVAVIVTVPDTKQEPGTVHTSDNMPIT